MSNQEALEEVIRGRRSVRQYREDPVPENMILRLVEDAAFAPSAGNRQDWEFTVLTKRPIKERMADAVRESWSRMLSDPNAGGAAESLGDYTRHFDWFARAPVVIAVSARRPEAFLTALCGEDAAAVYGGTVSAAMAAQNLMLSARAAGLGTCCLTGPLAAGKSLKQILHLGNRREIVCLITLGYPAEEPAAPSRRPIGEIMRTVE